jgi:hypothetical protein
MSNGISINPLKIGKLLAKNKDVRSVAYDAFKAQGDPAKMAAMAMKNPNKYAKALESFQKDPEQLKILTGATLPKSQQKVINKLIDENADTIKNFSGDKFKNKFTDALQSGNPQLLQQTIADIAKDPKTKDTIKQINDTIKDTGLKDTITDIVKTAKGNSPMSQITPDMLKGNPDLQKRFGSLLNEGNSSFASDLKALERLTGQNSGIVGDVVSAFSNQEDESEKQYGEAYEFMSKARIISEKLKNKAPISVPEHNIILTLDEHIARLKGDYRYKSPNTDGYYEYVNRVDKFARENLKEENHKYLNDDPDKYIKDPDKIYFEDYVGLFKLCLSLFSYLCIFLVIFILLLSVVGLLKLIVDLVVNIASLFVNTDNLSRSLSLDFLNKTMTRCTKDNFSDDRFFILTEQKQNITIFNIGIYVIYLFILYFFVYFVLILYSKIMKMPIIGGPQLLFQPPLFVFLIAFMVLYSIIHLMIYKIIFKQYVYSPYKTLQLREKEIDEKIADYILIYSQDGSGEINNSQVLVDHKFFDILYDASRIDELNDIFAEGIRTEDASNCLEQKIIIFNIYCYLREYIPFTKEMQDKFKDYCTSDANNKPKFTNSDITMSFVAMLNNNEIKMIRKYNESLNYYNEIPDENIEYFNYLNTSITEKIKNINLLILTNTNTMIPFFLTIVYVCFIVVLNLAILYAIIYLLSSRKEETQNEFNPYIFLLLYNIKIYIYDPMIKYIMGGYK